MTIAIIILSILALSLAVFLLRFNQKIKLLNQQLDFILKEKTEMRIDARSSLPSLLLLQSKLNLLIESYKRSTRQSKQEERIMKDTISGLSHDIRTPLTSIDGYLQLLAKAEDENDRERYLNIIRTRVSSLRQILDELFTFSKLQHEDYQLELETCNFTKQLSHALFSFYEEFKQRNLEPNLKLPDEPLFVMAQPEALSRILQNLLKNALEHGVGEINIHLSQVDGQAKLVCSNNLPPGTNLAVEDIFQQFYKASSARKGSSTGLGLSIAKGLCEKMGGVIEAEIRDEQFIIYLFLQLAPSPQTTDK